MSYRNFLNLWGQTVTRSRYCQLEVRVGPAGPAATFCMLDATTSFRGLPPEAMVCPFLAFSTALVSCAQGCKGHRGRSGHYRDL